MRFFRAFNSFSSSLLSDWHFLGSQPLPRNRTCVFPRLLLCWNKSGLLGPGFEPNRDQSPLFSRCQLEGSSKRKNLRKRSGRELGHFETNESSLEMCRSHGRILWTRFLGTPWEFLWLFWTFLCKLQRAFFNRNALSKWAKEAGWSEWLGRILDCLGSWR